MQIKRFIQVFVLAFSVLTITAEEGEAASSNVVLEVTGDLSDAVTTFEIEELREIGETEVVTSTIWTDGVHRFTGVSLKDLLDHLNIDGSEIKATAINDYAITIPVGDAVQNGPIVAYEMDGAPMSRRSKGPLWIIYPFDQSSKYRTEAIYARSIWQLNRIHITE